PRQGAPLLHGALLAPRLQQLHPRRCDAAEPAGDLERPRLSGFPPRPADRRPAALLRALWPAVEPLMPQRPRIAVVIPTLNEEEPISAVVGAVPRDAVDEIIVADSGSRDRTGERRRAAGARAVVERERGYGRACAAGARAAGDCDIIVFLDGDGSDRPELMPRLLAPILAGTHDFVIGSRTRGEREAGSMNGLQIAAGYMA